MSVHTSNEGSDRRLKETKCGVLQAKRRERGGTRKRRSFSFPQTNKSEQEEKQERERSSEEGTYVPRRKQKKQGLVK